MHRIYLLFLVITTAASYAEESKSILWSTTIASPAGPGFSTPTVGDLDGDLSNGNEVVISSGGSVTAFSSTGAQSWTAQVPSANCPGVSESDRVYSSPTIGILKKNETPAIVIGYGPMTARGCDGGVVAFDGQSGQEKWHFSIAEHSKKLKYFVFRMGVFSKPAISPVQKDGFALISFGSFARNIYLLQGDGAVRFYYEGADTVFSSPTFYRSTLGTLRFTIGQDISQNTKIKPQTFNGGYLNVFGTNALPKTNSNKKIPFRSTDNLGKTGLIYQTYLDQTIQSSPSIEDVDSSSPGPEIIVGTGCYFPENLSPKLGNKIIILNEKTRKVLSEIPTNTCMQSSPVVLGTDLVAFIDSGKTNVGGDGIARLITYKRETVDSKSNWNKLWEVEIPSVSQWQSPKKIQLSDGSIGVAIFAGGRIRAYDSSTGTLVWKGNVAGDPNNASISIGDVNGDGIQDAIFVGDVSQGVKVSVIGG